MNPIEYILELKRVINHLYPLYYWEVLAWELVMGLALVSGIFSFLFIMKYGKKIIKEDSSKS